MKKARKAFPEKPREDAKKPRLDAILLDRLHGKCALEALQEIAESSENNYDKVVEFIGQGGTVYDLLSILDRADKPKNPELSVVFNACETTLLHLASGEAENEETAQKRKQLALEITRHLLEQHLGYMMRLLSGSNTSYQVRSSLRLLTAMVTCGPPTAKEVLLKVDFDHKHWDSVCKRHSTEIRPAFVQFTLSFLLLGHSGVAKEYLEKKAKRLASIFPGLSDDDPDTIDLVLVTLKEKILENSSISKTTKMRLFSVHNLKPILALVSKAEELVLDFFNTALTSIKYGLVFHDPSYGTSGTNHNHLLQSLLQTITCPWEQPLLASLVAKSLSTCPDQLKPYVQKMVQPVWTPRQTDSWMQVMDFLYTILQGVAIKIDKQMTNKLLSQVICPALESQETPSVSRKGIELLALLLDKIPTSDKMPPLSSIIKFWHEEVQRADSPLHLLAATKVIDFYKGQGLDWHGMLEKAQNMFGSEKVQLYLLKNASAPFNLDHIRTLVRIGTNEALDILNKILNVNEDELKLWIYYISNKDQVEEVAKCLYDGGIKGLVKSSVLAEKHEDYYAKCMTASVLLQEDPVHFCEQNDLSKRVPTVPEGCKDEAFERLLCAMQKLLALEYENTGCLQDFLDYLMSMNKEERMDIVLKILGKQTTEVKADLLVKLLEMLDDEKHQNIKQVYVDKFVEKVTEALESGHTEDQLCTEQAAILLPTEGEQLNTLFDVLLRNYNSFRKQGHMLKLLALTFDKVLEQRNEWDKETLLQIVKIAKDCKSECLLKSVVELLKVNEAFSGLFEPQDIDNLGVEMLSVLVEKNHHFAEAFKKRLAKKPQKYLEDKYMPSVCAAFTFEGQSEQVAVIKSEIVKKLKRHLLKEENQNLGNFVEILCRSYKVSFINDVEDILPLEKPSVLQHKTVLSIASVDKNPEQVIDWLIRPLMQAIMVQVKSESTEQLCQIALDSLNLLEKHELERLNKKEWASFVKKVLKYGPKNRNFQVVKLLKSLCSGLYEEMNEEKEREVELLYNMIVGHSSFVHILFSNNVLKEEMLDLIGLLVQRNSKVCTSSQIPVYLGAYGATLSASDQFLLTILEIHEKRVSFSAYTPIMWGQSAASRYSVKTRTQHLARLPKVSQVLALINPEKMVKTSIQFPSSMDQLDPNDESCYDPRFFLPLICQLCSSGSYIDRHLKLIESGLLGLAFASLSCKDGVIRTQGSVALARIYKHLEGAPKALSEEKQLWLHIIDLVRNGLWQVMGEKKSVPKLPHIVTTFLVKASMILTNGADPMFKAVCRFLLAKPVMEVFTVPDFLRLFHSNDPLQHQVEQEWVLCLIRDGMRDQLDYDVAEQNHVFKIILSYHDCSLAEPSTKAIILDIVANAARLPKAAHDLLRNHSIGLWVLNQVTDDDNKKLSRLAKIVYTLWFTVGTNEDNHRKKKAVSNLMLSDLYAMATALLNTGQHFEGKPFLLTVVSQIRPLLEI